MAIKIDGDAAIYDLELVRGADGTYKLVFTDDDAAPIDLTGYTVTVKAHLGDLDCPVVYSREATLLTQSGATLGQATFEIRASDFTAANSDPHGLTKWAWSATIEAAGKVRVPIAGTWNIHARPIVPA